MATGARVPVPTEQIHALCRYIFYMGKVCPSQREMQSRMQAKCALKAESLRNPYKGSVGGPFNSQILM